MSQQSVELARRVLEAINPPRDVDAFIGYCDPSIEFHSVFAAVGGAVYRGHDALRRWHRDVQEAWGDEIFNAPEAYFDLGEYTLVFHVLHGRGRHSGVKVNMPVAHVFRWRDGLLVYSRLYVHREDALRDLGVSADALEPIAP
jgi:ketosteroid isomerase-like protein